MFFNGKRVIYKNHQLETVTFQVNFDTISIQDSMSEKFYREMDKKFLTYIKPQKVFVNGNEKIDLDSNYFIVNEEDKILLVFSNNYFAVSFKNYTKFEELLYFIDKPIKIFEQIFNIQFYNRVAIRYIDIFQPSKLGIINVKWEDYIKKEYLGFYNIKQNEIEIIKNETLMNIDDISKVRIITGIWNHNDEKCFHIDSDFYRLKKIISNDMFDALGIIHDQSIGLLDEIITDKLKKILEPENV